MSPFLFPACVCTATTKVQVLAVCSRLTVVSSPGFPTQSLHSAHLFLHSCLIGQLFHYPLKTLLTARKVKFQFLRTEYANLPIQINIYPFPLYCLFLVCYGLTVMHFIPTNFEIDLMLYIFKLLIAMLR